MKGFLKSLCHVFELRKAAVLRDLAEHAAGMDQAHCILKPLVLEIFLKTGSELFGDQMRQMGDRKIFRLGDIRKPDLGRVVGFNYSEVSFRFP